MSFKTFWLLLTKKIIKTVTCLSEENSWGRSVKTLFFKSTDLREVIFPINGGTFLNSLLQILKDLGFPLVAFNKILSAILYLCKYCSRARVYSLHSSSCQMEGMLWSWIPGKMSGVSFVSETELDEIRERRQQEWEKVRKEDDPLGKLKYFVTYWKSSANVFSSQNVNNVSNFAQQSISIIFPLAL